MPAGWRPLSDVWSRLVALPAEGKGTIEEQKRRIFTKLGTRDIKRVIALCAEALRPVALSVAPLPCPLGAGGGSLSAKANGPGRGVYPTSSPSCNRIASDCSDAAAA